MHVVIAIVAFNNADDIARCLGALGDSTYQDFEVVICENGGAEAFARLRAATPAVLPTGQPVCMIMAPANLGYAGGVNVCLAARPTAEAWWVLNPDTCPDSAALAGKVGRLAKGDCDAVGCTLVLPNGQVQSHGGRWNAWLARGISMGHGTSQLDPPDPVAIEAAQNYLNGAAMLVSRRFLAAVGPMREEYFLYCEEVEWCLRAGALGQRFGFAMEARVLHFQGTTTGNPPDIRLRSQAPVYLNERNKLLLTRDLFPRRMPVVAITAFLVIFMRFGRRLAWRQLGYALGGWAAGLRDERGPPSWIRR